MSASLVVYKGWAIQTDPDVLGRFIGVGWFDQDPHKTVVTTQLFCTRREARAAIGRVRIPYGFPRSQVVRVRVSAAVVPKRKPDDRP